MQSKHIVIVLHPSVNQILPSGIEIVDNPIGLIGAQPNIATLRDLEMPERKALFFHELSKFEEVDSLSYTQVVNIFSMSYLDLSTLPWLWLYLGLSGAIFKH